MSILDKILKGLGILLIEHDREDIGKIHSDYLVPFGVHHYLWGVLAYGIGTYREEMKKLREQEK